MKKKNQIIICDGKPSDCTNKKTQKIRTYTVRQGVRGTGYRYEPSAYPDSESEFLFNKAYDLAQQQLITKLQKKEVGVQLLANPVVINKIPKISQNGDYYHGALTITLEMTGYRFKNRFYRKFSSTLS